MIAATARTYVRAHYVIILAVIAVALGCYALHEHDARIRSEALWKVKYSAADAALRTRDGELAGAKARTDSASRHVTQLLAAARVDTMWRHDTLHVAGDTTLRVAVPLPTVLRQDSTNAACSLLAVTCKAERVAAQNRADAAEHKLQVALAKPERSCRNAFLWGAAAAAAGDEVLHGRIRIPLLSFSR